MTHLTRRGMSRLLAGAALLPLARPARALPAAPAEDDVILSVSGRIGETNAEGRADFSREMLEALGTVSFRTQTPWYAAPVTFTGVPMARLMSAVGAAGTLVTAEALNDYATEIPVEDFARFGTVLALKRDGAYMPVRDKGPLFIVYPYDSNPELQSRRYYSRSAWQVARMKVS